MAQMKIPKVVIVGRQNVGKSTLFNALARRRHAIVSEKPGVTRDYISKKIKIDDYEIELIDTGGIAPEDDDITYLVRLKAYEIVEKSDLVIFLVEKPEPVPIEYDIADFLRKKGKKVILVINKVDNPEEAESPELFATFYTLGYNNFIMISAVHKINLRKLQDEIIKNLEFKPAVKKVDEDEIKIAIVGKPNVGKSSILNRILNEDRSIVTPIPGTTRDSIDTEIRYYGKKIVLIDTAGMRRKARVKENLEYYGVNRAVKSIKRSQIVVLVISADDFFTHQDKTILSLILRYGKGCVIVVNKWDLIRKTSRTQDEFKERIKVEFPSAAHIPVLFVSALKNLRVSKILPAAIEVYKEYTKRIPTHEFNKFIYEIVNTYSPPQKGGRVRIYYGTQAETAPPLFVLFTNKPEVIKENYRKFLINKIREKYGFNGVPILLKFRHK